MKTEPELLAIKARADAATAGPWAEAEECEATSMMVYSEAATGKNEDCGQIAIVLNAQNAEGITTNADSKFIAAARTDIPALVESHLEALKRIGELEASRSGNVHYEPDND